MSYESPIEMFYNDTIQNIANQIKEETDDRIVCEVKMQCGVNIDKDELIKALKYDRDQYNKGYQDAMNDARARFRHVRIIHPKYGECDSLYDEARHLLFVDYITKEFADRSGWKIKEET